MKRQIFLLTIIVGFLLPFYLFSQEIRANVSVNMDQIPFDSRQYVTSLKYDLENYINNQKFTDIEWDGPRIPVEISIYLTGANKTYFSAQLIVISKRIIRGTNEEGQSVAMKFLDKNWSFEYQSGAMLSYNPTRFNEFTSLIDFYMLLVIAHDLDTYGELDGTKYYDQAKQIIQMAASQNKSGYSINYQPGELTRYSIVSEFSDPRYEPFRKAIFSYYVDGLDLMAENPTQAKQNIIEAIEDMADFKKNKLTSASNFILLFFDAKAPEIAQIFRGESNSKIWDSVLYLDPTNTMLYQEAMKAR